MSELEEAVREFLEEFNTQAAGSGLVTRKMLILANVLEQEVDHLARLRSKGIYQ